MAARTRVEEQTAPSTSTGGTAATRIPRGRAERRQQADVAGAAVAEAEVLARRDGPDAEPVGERVAHEVLGRLPHQPAVEAKRVEHVHAQLRRELGLAAQGRQPGGGRLGLDDLARVRLEGDDAQGRAELARERRGGGDHRAVAPVEAVEVADRDRRTAHSARRPGARPDDAHGGLSPTRAGGCKAVWPSAAPSRNGFSGQGCYAKALTHRASKPGVLMDRGQADALVADLGARLGLSGLALDEGGVATLTLGDSSMVLSIGHAPGGAGALDLMVSLEGVEATGARVAEAALSANFGWRAAGGGACFAVEPSSGALVLQRRCADEDGPRLHDILENLLVAAETWAARLASAPGAAAADKAARDRSGEPVHLVMGALRA
jgi:hypothetical protein